ncbi:MAG: hypothetical protein J5826_04480 [Bacteroidales bacterium]|nr:hypothetical protein [Bacteroidales bacterium]
MRKILFYFTLSAMMICVCGKSMAQSVTLQSIVERDTVMSDDARMIFKLLNINNLSWDKDEYVEVNEPYFASSDNGFIAPVLLKNKLGYTVMEDGLNAQFRIYKIDDGKYLVVYADIWEKPIKFWSYDNGTIIPLPKYQLPVPAHGKRSKKNYYCTMFRSNGYEICHGDIWSEVYMWNGKEFVRKE